MTSNIKKLIEFTTPAALDDRLASVISSALMHEIQAKGHANLAVSGGRTPLGLFKLLAEKEIDWGKVNLTLADERWVKTSSRDSNEKTLRETLLQSHAAAARFIPLRQGNELERGQLDRIEEQLREADAFPFDVLTLGMGEDGHTASLFPSADEIYEAMAPENPHLLTRIVPKTAPYDRVTFTLAALLKSRKVYLHLLGSSKLEVLKRAEEGDSPMEMPIRAFLQDPELDMDIYWAPK